MRTFKDVYITMMTLQRYNISYNGSTSKYTCRELYLESFDI